MLVKEVELRCKLFLMPGVGLDFFVRFDNGYLLVSIYLGCFLPVYLKGLREIRYFLYLAYSNFFRFY